MERLKPLFNNAVPWTTWTHCAGQDTLQSNWTRDAHAHRMFDIILFEIDDPIRCAEAESKGLAHPTENPTASRF